MYKNRDIYSRINDCVTLVPEANTLRPPALVSRCIRLLSTQKATAQMKVRK